MGAACEECNQGLNSGTCMKNAAIVRPMFQPLLLACAEMAHTFEVVNLPGALTGISWPNSRFAQLSCLVWLLDGCALRGKYIEPGQFSF